MDFCQSYIFEKSESRETLSAQTVCWFPNILTDKTQIECKNPYED